MFRASVDADSLVHFTGLRATSGEKVDERVRRFYAERFVPTLEPRLELEFDRLPFTHGPSIVSGGKAGLRKTIAAPVWHHGG